MYNTQTVLKIRILIILFYGKEMKRKMRKRESFLDFIYIKNERIGKYIEKNSNKRVNE